MLNANCKLLLMLYYQNTHMRYIARVMQTMPRMTWTCSPLTAKVPCS